MSSEAANAEAGEPAAKKPRRKISDEMLSAPNRQLVKLFWEGCVEKREARCHKPISAGGLGRLIWPVFTVRHAAAPHQPLPAHPSPLFLGAAIRRVAGPPGRPLAQ